MRISCLTLMAVLALSGCTTIHETLLPHRDLKSPCACAEDATPVNAQLVLASVIVEGRV